MANERVDFSDRFKHHSPNEAKTLAHQVIRDACWELATTVLARTPVGREQALALTKIEEAMFWANAGIARNG